MKVEAILYDCHHSYGDSYKIQTDNGQLFHISPENKSSVLIGLIDQEKAYDENGIMQITYEKGVMIPFINKLPILNKTIRTADDVVKDIILFAINQPDEFEKVFNRLSMSKGKEDGFPTASRRKFIMQDVYVSPDGEIIDPAELMQN